MKRTKAIEIINEMKTHCEGDTLIALNIAQTDMEHETPMRVRMVKVGNQLVTLCSSCGTGLTKDSNYCHKCGKPALWG